MLTGRHEYKLTNTHTHVVVAAIPSHSVFRVAGVRPVGIARERLAARDGGSVDSSQIEGEARVCWATGVQAKLGFKQRHRGEAVLSKKPGGGELRKGVERREREKKKKGGDMC